jgi:hypothetical protein
MAENCWFVLKKICSFTYFIIINILDSEKEKQKSNSKNENGSQADKTKSEDPNHH